MKSKDLPPDLDHLDLGSMTDAMKALLQKITLRAKKVVALDLTTEISEKDALENDQTKSDQTKSDSKKTKMEKRTVDLKLPERLSLSMIRCVEKDRVGKYQLVVYQTHYPNFHHPNFHHPNFHFIDWSGCYI